MQFFEKNNAINAKSDAISIHKKGEEVVLNGNVRINRTDFFIYSNQSTIFQKKNSIKSIGNAKTYKIFENGNYLNSISNSVFYSDFDKILEFNNIKKLDYFIKKDNRMINLISKYLKLEQKKDKNFLNIRQLKKLIIPFTEEKINDNQETAIIDGTNFVKANNVYGYSNAINDEILFVEMNKNVFLERKKSNNEYIKIIADNLIYNKEKSISTINDIKEINYIDENKNEYLIFCKNIVWDMETDIIEFFGNPIIFQKKDKSYIINSKKAFFYNKDKIVLFFKKPVLFQEDETGKGLYKAEKILYYINEKIIKFEDTVEIEFIQKNTKQKIEDKAENL
ncbi:MAG: LPS export ABC transporter periplasmic protein LptC [Elusimicrobiota bacterium]|nr:LPS export ABC transporter periplasmic protein LptC [Elusimicrobiota bacterium]